MRVYAQTRLGWSLCLALVLTLSCVRFDTAFAQGDAISDIRFDVPQVAEAAVVTPLQENAAEILVSLELAVSVIVDSLTAPRIDQLLVEITPRGGTAIVADYAPRTELASEYTGGIEVQQTGESSQSFGLSLEGRYPPLASGTLSASKGEKNIATSKFSRVAPLHLIAASGTTQRGRGVYFKFRSTDQQIIEGDRVLSLTLRVPASWRGELLDVQIRGDSMPRGFSWSVAALAAATPKPERIGGGRFLVATYRGDDPQAKKVTRRLADAETLMRQRVQGVTAESLVSTISGPTALLRHVSHRIDWSQGDRVVQQKAAVAMHRALDGTLAPHVDRDFKDLPVETRVSFLEYLDARQEYLDLAR